jgi:hypothetical protein
MKIQITKENIYEMLNNGDIKMVFSEDEICKIKDYSFAIMLKKENNFVLKSNTKHASIRLAEDISKIENVELEFI